MFLKHKQTIPKSLFPQVVSTVLPCTLKDGQLLHTQFPRWPCTQSLSLPRQTAHSPVASFTSSLCVVYVPSGAETLRRVDAILVPIILLLKT